MEKPKPVNRRHYHTKPNSNYQKTIDLLNIDKYREYFDKLEGWRVGEREEDIILPNEP